MSAEVETRPALSHCRLRELLTKEPIATSVITSHTINLPRAADIPSLRLAGRIPVLAGLPSVTIQRVLAGCRVQSYRTGAILFEEGDPVRHLHVPLNGLVELFTVEKRRDHTLLIMSPGEVFMPGAALDGRPHPLFARCLRPAKVLLLDAVAIRREMISSAAFANRITGITNAQLQTVLSELSQLRSRTGPQRLAAFLLHLIDGSPLPGSAELPFPKKVLASRMGISAETLSRSLQLLADNGLALRGGRAVLLDRAEVERFCRGTQAAPDARKRPAQAEAASRPSGQVRSFMPAAKAAEQPILA